MKVRVVAALVLRVFLVWAHEHTLFYPNSVLLQYLMAFVVFYSFQA